MDHAEAMREEFVRELLKNHSLSARSITRVQRARNNHVYRVDLSEPPSIAQQTSPRQPGTVEFPPNIETVCVRLSIDEVALETSTRITNQVACLNLAREALEQSGLLSPEIVPLVFSWGDKTPTSRGWLLQQWMTGTTISNDKMPELGLEQQGKCAAQIAKLIKSFQEYQLPKQLTELGGVGYDSEGQYVGSLIPMQYGGPFSGLKDLLKGAIQWHLLASERTPYLDGYNSEPGLRDRLDAFLAKGIDKLFAEKGVPDAPHVLTHGDLDPSNLLFDESTLQLTGIVDFDLSHIGVPLSEYLLADFNFRYIALGIQDESWSSLPAEEILHGFPANPTKAQTDSTAFTRAKLFDDVLAKVGTIRPSDVKGATVIADLWWFAQDVCQPFFFIPHVLKNWGPKFTEKMRDESLGNVKRYLAQWGY